MNERIRELAEQAELEYNFDPMLWLKYEKFAELIVLECMDVFGKDLPDPTNPDYQLGTLTEVVNRVCNVAEHFGVE
jgi:hypothetical protein